MIQVTGIRFKKAGKIYYFDPDNLSLEINKKVIVETVRGVEFGYIVIPSKEVKEEDIISPLKKVIRVASDEDCEHHRQNKQKEQDAYKICFKKIEKHKLEMKLIDVEYTFDNNKILFYFTAEGRIDFRELVKDLAAVFKTRIELRQIGVRDEAKMMGGAGICGLKLCCNTFLGEFQPVSIKMAKEQGLSLNPTKISGNCGRLMCCLKYEHEAYEDLLKIMPKVGSIVKTAEGSGTVEDVFLLKGLLKIRLDKVNETDLKLYSVKDVKIIKSVAKETDEYIEKEVLKELKQLED